jgi:8-oxo-dGTP diphosphatase
VILLIRHAWAGHQGDWDGDDRLRPLDERGQRQAFALVDVLEEYDVRRIVSSPYVRCVQTVEPLASARRLEIEPRDELGEDQQNPDALGLLQSLRAEDVAVCTHGGVDKLLRGVDEYEKGSVVVLDSDLEPVRYLPPPA